VRVNPQSKDLPALTGTLRVVDHELPVRGKSLNLEVALPVGKPVTLQLTGAEAEQLIASAETRELEFRWNGKPRTLRPVPAEDMIPAEPREVYAGY
jgi:hypothetical protein